MGLAGTRLAVLGAGKLGETLIAALTQAGVVDRADVTATARDAGRLAEVGARCGVRTTLDTAAAVRDARLVLLCVKPRDCREALVGVRDALTPEHLVISTVTAATTATLEAAIGTPVPVVRAMPNTPVLVRQGMTALCGGRHATPDHLRRAEAIFAPVGRTVVLDERHFDAVTGLSASGPAFIFIVIESLAEGGVKVGLPRQTATLLAAQAVLGAAAMVLQTGQHPALLKDAVTTPAGCTIDGILKLEEGGLRVTLIKTIVEATTRAGQLLG